MPSSPLRRRTSSLGRILSNRAQLDRPVFKLHSGEAAQPLSVLVEAIEQALFHLTIEHRPLDRAREKATTEPCEFVP
jgi:hypothetical protein